MSDHPKDRAADLIAELRAGGEVVDEGTFTFDAAAAARKFAEFRYPDRSRYLLHAAEGLRGLGARELRIRRRGGDVELDADVTPIEHAARRLEAIYGEKFASAEVPGASDLGRIAVALDMARGLEHMGQVIVEHRSPTRRVRAAFGPEGQPTLDEVEGSFEPGMTLIFDRSFRGELVGSRDAEREVQQLVDATRHGRGRVVVADQRVEPASEPTLLERETHDGFDLVHGFVDDPDAPLGRVICTHHGVEIEARPAKTPEFFADIRLHEAPRDLSESGLLHGEAWTRAQAAADAAETRARAKLEEVFADWLRGDRALPPGWDRERIGRVLGHESAYRATAARSGSRGCLVTILSVLGGFGLLVFLAARAAPPSAQTEADRRAAEEWHAWIESDFRPPLDVRIEVEGVLSEDEVTQAIRPLGERLWVCNRHANLRDGLPVVDTTQVARSKTQIRIPEDWELRGRFHVHGNGTIVSRAWTLQRKDGTAQRSYEVLAGLVPCMNEVLADLELPARERPSTIALRFFHVPT